MKHAEARRSIVIEEHRLRELLAVRRRRPHRHRCRRRGTAPPPLRRYRLREGRPPPRAAGLDARSRPGRGQDRRRRSSPSRRRCSSASDRLLVTRIAPEAARGAARRRPGRHAPRGRPLRHRRAHRPCRSRTASPCSAPAPPTCPSPRRPRSRPRSCGNDVEPHLRRRRRRHPPPARPACRRFARRARSSSSPAWRARCPASSPASSTRP